MINIETTSVGLSGKGFYYSKTEPYQKRKDNNSPSTYRWAIIKISLQTQNRFFNKTTRLLKEIFNGLHLLRSETDKPIVYEIKPNDENAVFFRARICNDPEKQRAFALAPEKHLGPPPSKLCTPGRMNASGIRVFYGAFELDTCVSELHPSVGDAVVAAKFVPNRSLLVLDTTRCTGRPIPTNPFDKAFVNQARLWNFMSIFKGEIARPSLPNAKHLEYVSTQVVAEFLSNEHKFPFEGKERTIDAIIFQSSQNRNGKNIALFGKAAEVRPPVLDHPEGDNDKLRALNYFMESAALSVISDSVILHRIEGVQYNSSSGENPLPKKT